MSSSSSGASAESLAEASESLPLKGYMEKLISEIAAIVADVAEVPVGQITEHTSLKELGVDSLDALRIIAAIEKKYHLEVPEEKIGEAKCLSDIAVMVAASV